MRRYLLKQTSEFDQTFGAYKGDSISKTLGPPTPLLPDPNPFPLAEESGGAQPIQKVAVIFGKNGGTSWLGGKKRSLYLRSGSRYAT